MAYIATQLRTEKWNGLMNEDCIDPLLAEFDEEFKRARQLGIQHLYLATDAMPGGILISKTYSSQVSYHLGFCTYMHTLYRTMTDSFPNLSLADFFTGKRQTSSLRGPRRQIDRPRASGRTDCYFAAICDR